MPIEIIDGSGTRKKAIVTKYGQLVTSPISYDEVANATADTAGTAYNLFSPKSGKRFVITTILLTAKKDITGDVVIDVYESDTFQSTSISKSILQVEMLKNSARDFIGLNLLITAGKWVTIKADDDTVLVTCMGYYIPPI